MSGSCHLDRASNVEIGVECQIFVIVIFFNCGRVLQFGAHSRYYKGALTQKRSFLVICTTFRSDFHVGWKNQNKHSTLNSSFDTLSKWHEPDIREHFLLNCIFTRYLWDFHASIVRKMSHENTIVIEKISFKSYLSQLLWGNDFFFFWLRIGLLLFLVIVHEFLKFG